MNEFDIIKSIILRYFNIQYQKDYIPDDFEILPGRATLNEEIYLGPDEYFVSGDNRPHSSDSRFWGPITKDEIVGRVFLRYWPISEIELIKKAEYPAGF